MSLNNKHPMAASLGWPGLRWILLGLVVLTTFSVGVDAAESPRVVPASRADLTELNKLSQQLIAKVKGGNAKATEFRTNVVYYRESLRSLLLANEKSTHDQFPAALQMQMVRMAALLQSAADCQTGRYITCPANLLSELDRQQQQLNRALTGEPGATSSP